MDLRFTQDEIRFRDEVRTFCSENLPKEIYNKQVRGQRLSKEDIVFWQRSLNKKGWACPLWLLQPLCRWRP